MPQEIPRNLGPAIKSFDERHKSKKQKRIDFVVGGMGPGLYRMAVEKSRNALRIGVKNEYLREYHLGEKKPFFSDFTLGIKLDKDKAVKGVGKSAKDQIKAGAVLVKKHGIKREGLIKIANEIADRRGKGMFIVGLDIPDEGRVELIYQQEDMFMGQLKTIVMNGEAIDGKDPFYLEFLGRLKSMGLTIPSFIDLFKTAKRLLTQELTPQQMREIPFEGNEVAVSEHQNYEKAPDMLGRDQN
jgi:hypothetical protein